MFLKPLLNRIGDAITKQLPNVNWKLATHFKNYFSASIATKAIGFISIPILTRLLSTSDYGLVNIFNSYVNLFSIVFSLNLFSSIGRYYYEGKDDIHKFIGTSLLLALSSLLISFLLIYFVRSSFGEITKMELHAIWLMFGAIFNIIILSCYTQVLQPERRSKKLSIVNVARAYTILFFIIIFILRANNKYYGYIYAHIIIGFAFSVYILYDMKSRIRFSIKKEHVIYIFKYSVPLIPYALSSFILAQFDRIMIHSYIGSDSAGLYSFAYNIGYLSAIFMGAIMNSWTPYYFDYMNKKEYGILKKEAKSIFRFFLIGSYMLILFCYEIGKILGSSQYTESLYLVPIIVIGYVFFFIANLYLRNIDYLKKTIYMSLIMLLSGSVNILLNAVLIPSLGIIAGGITTVISYALMLLLSYLMCKQFLDYTPFELSLFLKDLFTFFFMIGCWYLLEYSLDSVILKLGIKIFTILFFGIIFLRTKKTRNKQWSRQ